MGVNKGEEEDEFGYWLSPSQFDSGTEDCIRKARGESSSMPLKNLNPRIFPMRMR